MTGKIDFSRSLRGAAWALVRVSCVGLLFLGTANCLPAPAADNGGSGGNGGNASPQGGTTHASQGGSTYVPPSGGSTYVPPSGGSTYVPPSGGSTYVPPTGGSTYVPPSGGSTYVPPTGGSTYVPPTGGSTYVPPTGGTTTTPPAGGTTSATPTGTTVTFSTGKAAGAMTGYGWVALGSADSLTDPTCGSTQFTSTTNCAATTWGTANPNGLCMSGAIPALAATNPDYTGNWGVEVGVNATATPGGGLGQSFSSIAITVSGTPTSGLRAMLHRKTDPVGQGYCAAMTSGTPIPFTSFNTKCYDTPADGTALTATDVPNIDQVGVQVSSGSAAITVSSLCITGITFAQ
ncbi:MAG: hypothetical protein WCG85_13740 [Polyangia bacterium]